MKKQLIGTTALVGVGALAASGTMQDAQAADPLSLTVGGYLQVSLEYRDEDDGNGEPGNNRQQFDIYDDGEIQFTASTTLDNGIGVRARIEFEAKNQGQGSTTVDERYLDFSGGFGQLRIGEDDNASNAMHYQAPVAAGMMGVNTPTFAIPLSGGNAITSYPTTYVNTGGDAEKVIWFSPRIAGFQLGVSYAPDDQRQDQIAGQGPSLPSFDNNAGGQQDVISIGLNFVETFDSIDVAVSGGYLQGDLESGPGDDMEQWSAGLNVGFAGFTVGASIRLSNQGTNNADLTIWDAGVTYATGPLTVGFTYLQGQAENGGNGDDETNQFVVSGVYNIGPGVDLWGGVKYFDYESGTNSGANENEGYIVAIGSSVSF
jgi:outer membrane protein OmpU